MKILVTGAAGFIGSKLIYELAKQNYDVVGIDNINDYYNVLLKYGRLQECGIEKIITNLFGEKLSLVKYFLTIVLSTWI